MKLTNVVNIITYKTQTILSLRKQTVGKTIHAELYYQLFIYPARYDLIYGVERIIHNEMINQ